MARDRRQEGVRQFWKWTLLLAPFGLSTSIDLGVRDYRSWTLEQLALATAYLLGPNEPMLAGEVSIYDLFDSWTRGPAVAVTAKHVVVFRLDHTDGQPRSIALAALLTDVKMEARSRVFQYLWPALMVWGWNRPFAINGYRGAFEPEPVLDVWRRAANRPVSTN